MEYIPSLKQQVTCTYLVISVDSELGLVVGLQRSVAREGRPGGDLAH